MEGPDRQFFVRKVAWFWFVATIVAAAAVDVWGTVTQPRPWALIGLVFTALLIAAGIRLMLRRPSYLDGTVLVQHGLLRTHRADLARATRVRLRGDRVGHVQLVVRDDSGRTAFESLLAITTYITLAQPPELLDRISQALATAAAGSGAAGVREVLALQADHLRRGGKAEDSPLRLLTSTSLLHTAQGASLLSILGHLD